MLYMMDILKKKCDDVLAEVADLVGMLSDYRDEQWVLDFCDKLNHYSIQY